MKRVYKYLFVFLGSLFMFPLVSNAECSYERQAELSKIASNVGFSYTYEIRSGNPVFIVDIVNVTNDIYVQDNENTIFTQDTRKEYVEGDTITYTIYSKDQACYGERVLDNYVSLPQFNKFSNFFACVHNPDFKYCQIWLNTKTITEEQFYSELDKYVDETAKKENSEQKILADSEQKKIEKNIMLLTVFVISLIVVLIIKRKMR